MLHLIELRVSDFRRRNRVGAKASSTEFLVLFSGDI